jgi:hypothetical protein
MRHAEATNHSIASCGSYLGMKSVEIDTPTLDEHQTLAMLNLVGLAEV